jgi:hypothetical protein
MSPAVREVTVRRVPRTGTPAVVTSAVLLLGFLTVLAIGALRRWRRLYWLLLLAFAGGLARLPIAVLQLSGGTAPEGPDWYIVVQGVIGCDPTRDCGRYVRELSPIGALGGAF